MILTARLFIAGHETEKDGIPLNFCEFSFSQDVDQRGLPVSAVKGGLIHLSYGSFDDPEILYWMISEKADKNGKILFSGVESSKAFKTLEFKDGRCVSYRETFTRDNEMLVELTISVREITVSGIDHVNSWSGYDN
jgi:hypothetical protein